ncbi:MAG: hypothetical protein K8R68_08925 [Bacteroidales bacterium]|nr:hypothetical protein [Bacteroidales bacterium]
MKSKKSLYILLPAVFLLWGFIVFKIFYHLGDANDNPVYYNSVQKIAEEDNVPDTFSLVLDYKDPFLSKVFDVSKKSNKKVKQVKRVTNKIIWPEIEYLGRMINPRTNKSRISITINGKEKIFSPGEIKDEVLLVKSFDDSIYVKYLGEKKTIFK